MLSNARRDIPIRQDHDARIERLRKNLMDAFDADRTVLGFRYRRLRFEVAHHFGLAGKPAMCEAFKSILDDRG
jgi:predicted Zn-dependent protease with MMP-like domain